MINSNNNEVEEEQQQEPRYRVIFSGCGHTAIKSQSELRNPVRRTELGNPVYLCWDCMHEGTGSESVSPYHRIVSITLLHSHQEQQQGKKKKQAPS